MRFRRDRSTTRAGFTAIASALALIAVQLSSPAVADPYPNTYYPDKGDYHTFCFTNAFANNATLLSRARYSMDNNDGLEAQTVVNTLEQACGALTDVKFYVADTGPSYGDANCVQFNSNGYCDQWDLRINWWVIQQLATNDGYQARKTLCHEIGHTVGLRHYESGHSPDTNPARDSCMITTLQDSGAAWTRQYGPHHKGHINGWFS